MPTAAIYDPKSHPRVSAGQKHLLRTLYVHELLIQEKRFGASVLRDIVARRANGGLIVQAVLGTHGRAMTPRHDTLAALVVNGCLRREETNDQFGQAVTLYAVTETGVLAAGGI